MKMLSNFKNLAIISTWAMVLATGIALAEPSDKTVKVLPDPYQWLDNSTVSWGVVHARKEDKGFQAFLKTAWQGMRNGGNSNSWLGLVSTFLSSAKQEDVLLGFLPFQGVRVDRLDPDGKDHSGTMVTIAGWPGVQSLFWNSLLTDSDGKNYQTESVNGQTLVLRPKPGQKPQEGPAVARVRGNFYAFSDPGTARSCMTSTGPSGDAYTIAKDLDVSGQDTYGVAVNRMDSLARFLEWMDKYDFQAVSDHYGDAKLHADLNKIHHVTWVGDLQDDDVMQFQFTLSANSEEDAEIVENLVKEARKALKAKGRAADLQMTTVRKDIVLRLQMIGYRQLLQNYFKNQVPKPEY